MCPMKLIVLAVCWVALGQNADTSFAADDVIVKIDGATITGSIQSIDENGIISCADGSEIPLSQVLSIQRGTAVVPPTGSRVEVYLAHGGLLRAQRAQLQNERVRIETGFGSVEVSIELIRAIVFKPAALTDSVRQDIAKPSNEFDTVWAESETGPQKAAGLIREIADGKLSGEFAGQERSVSQDRVIAFIAADLGLNQASGTNRLELIDGSTLRGTLDRLEQGQLHVQFSGGAKLEIPWTSVALISFESDRVAWLSEMQPLSQEQEPLVTAPRPARFNQSVDGNPLSLRTSSQPTPRVYAKGIGVHAYSRLVFRNDNEFDRLTAIVGIDAETQGQGDCKFIVQGDGVELWSARVRGSDEPLPIDVDVTNVREIALVVDPGEQLDLADHGNWCEAKLLKTKE